MKNKRSVCLFIFACILFWNVTLFSKNYSIVFVHIGEEIPSFLEDAISQSVLFNEKADIYLIANEKPIKTFSKRFDNPNIHFVSCESLSPSPEHLVFQKKTKLGEDWPYGFWKYATERFYYIDELISKYDLKDVFHLESDNMLYVSLQEVLPVFHKYYKGIAATFDNEDRCIAGFIYFPSHEKINKLIKFITLNASEKIIDMAIIAKYRKTASKDDIDYLPIIFQEYTNDYKLKSNGKHKTNKPSNFFNHITDFSSVFDAASIGQYLGGVSPINSKKNTVGFINESCLFNSSYLHYFWEKDHLGRKVPYVRYKGKKYRNRRIKGKKYRINNLHVHSKRLRSFSSMRENLK
jgi:hypothetical protein